MINIEDLDMLNLYIQGVIERADHHAPKVALIAPLFIGYVVAVAETGSVDAKEYVGRTANLLWFTSKRSGRRYALAYNHATEKIELRDRTLTGTVLHSFDNDTPLAQVKSAFDVL